MCGGELLGDPAQEIQGAASLAEAIAGEVTFYGDPRYATLLRKTQASAVFVPHDFSESIAAAKIRVENPAKAFEQVAFKFAPKEVCFAPGIHSTAIIDPSVKLGEGVSIQPYAVIEAGAVIGKDTIIGAGTYVGVDSTIGDQTTIYANVSIRERSRIGSRVMIHSGAVIGADGFGFEMVDGQYVKIPQIGIVQIDDDVEIGANTAIDRARFGRTWIQKGVKMDNLVHIAHNVIVGEHSAIAAGAGIAGSTRIGKHVMIAGQAGIIGHLEIGDGTQIGAQSGISKSIYGGTWLQSPAVPLADAKRHIAWLHRLGKLVARVRAIEEKLGL
jgi:UDP-3-O-[3-hydroxymyristoyl] glucosamine N-acyltransferase